ncbi:MAG: HypC/HybG/HupF family hydrogenase formation chaperone, partial [Trichodesmium sp. St18_bin1]|nr:HypC/HybG/HupF family hydrogenase formation chaperone [Trichodesmium sp. St18_bin1]MDE5119912.1 HypC/HybG/HupF family hydrogenase formation chaperone [Trichodesmium sp. St19_bin1]
YLREMCLGIPGQIVEITDIVKKLAMVSISGVKREVNIACILDEEHPVESCVGDWVLVHVGFAMNRLDEKEAKETLKLLQEVAEAMN